MGPDWWVPTQIITYSEASDALTATIATTVSTSSYTVPSGLPQAISGDSSDTSSTTVDDNDENTALESDYTLITIGFLKALNYEFLVKSPQSAAQIFSFLPKTLYTPLGVEDNNITVSQLLPYFEEGKDYTVTIAQVYFPISQIKNLQTAINDTSSALYTENESTEQTLAYLIDRSIPITGLSLSASISSDSSSSSSSDTSSAALSSSSSSSSSSSTDGDDSGEYGTLEYTGKTTSTSDGSSGSRLSKKKIIAIVVVVVVCSVIYLIAMGYMIRRYIKHIRNRPVIQLPIEDTEDMTSQYSGSNNNNSHGFSEKSLSNGSQGDNEDVVSMRINEWMNEAHFGKNEHTLNDYQAEQVTQIVRDIGRPKISRPIASENSLGWNDI